MTHLLAALLGALIGIALREVWVFRQVCTASSRLAKPAKPPRFSLRRALLSRLGQHTYDLLQRPDEWRRVGIDLMHSSGWHLDIQPGGGFDIADPPMQNDFRPELPWLDRFLLWPLVRDLDQRLEYPEIGA